MAITTFDTLKFVRRLQQAGVSTEQAEVQAEVLTEAFTVNLDNLVTKEHMTARFAEQNAYIDTRFAEQQSYMDTRFAQLDAKIDSKFNIIMWILGIIVAVDVIPYLQRLAEL